MKSEIREILTRRLHHYELPSGITLADSEAVRCPQQWRAFGAKRPKVMRETEQATGLLIAVIESVCEHYEARITALEEKVKVNEPTTTLNYAEPPKRGPGRPPKADK